jgi:hypothetical protein
MTIGGTKAYQGGAPLVVYIDNYLEPTRVEHLKVPPL